MGATIPRRRTLAEDWRLFLTSVVPEGAPPVQQTEMRRAFYAGADCAFLLLTGQLDPGLEPTDADVEYVESLHQELQAFARDVAEGRA